MNKKTNFMKKVLLLLLIPCFALAQTGPNREYWSTDKWTPKKGMTNEFEAAVAKKTKKFNNTKENAFFTYKIITGADQGKYMRIAGNRDAANFDVDNTAELDYWMKNVLPFAEGHDGAIRWWRMKGNCLNWDNDAPPARFIEMETYSVRRDKMSDFFRFWRNDVKLRSELGYTGVFGVFMLETGGEAFQLMVVQAYNSHAEGMGQFANPELDYVDEYNKKYGWRMHSVDRLAFNESILPQGIRVETAELEPEMSTKL
jgi:hypothetical protein